MTTSPPPAGPSLDEARAAAERVLAVQEPRNGRDGRTERSDREFVWLWAPVLARFVAALPAEPAADARLAAAPIRKDRFTWNDVQTVAEAIYRDNDVSDRPFGDATYRVRQQYLDYADSALRAAAALSGAAPACPAHPEMCTRPSCAACDPAPQPAGCPEHGTRNVSDDGRCWVDDRPQPGYSPCFERRAPLPAPPTEDDTERVEPWQPDYIASSVATDRERAEAVARIFAEGREQGLREAEQAVRAQTLAEWLPHFDRWRKRAEDRLAQHDPDDGPANLCMTCFSQEPCWKRDEALEDLATLAALSSGTPTDEETRHG